MYSDILNEVSVNQEIIFADGGRHGRRRRATDTHYAPTGQLAHARLLYPRHSPTHYIARRMVSLEHSVLHFREPLLCMLT